MGSMSIFQVAVSFAVLVMLAEAMPAREEVDRYLSRLQHAPRFEDYNGYKIRNLDALGGGNLLRDIHPGDFGFGDRRAEAIRRMQNEIPLEYYYPINAFRQGEEKSTEKLASTSKRFGGSVNFDEIDHSNFGGFKRNF